MKATLFLVLGALMAMGCDSGDPGNASDPNVRGELATGGATGSAGGTGAGGADVGGVAGSGAGAGGALGSTGGMSGAGGARAAAGGATGSAGSTGSPGAGGGGGVEGAFPSCPTTGQPLKTSPCVVPVSHQQLWLSDANGQHACDICTQGVDTSTLPCVGARLCVASCSACAPLN